MEKQKIDDLCRKIQDFIAKSPMDDVKKNLKAVLLNNLSDLDLVTREEFDIQKAVLIKTREKLTELESRIVNLNQQEGSD